MSTRKLPAKPKAAALPPAKPAPRKNGRPPYEPNDKDRTMVRLLCAGGITQDRIAEAVGISEPTLRKHYKAELLIGKAQMDALAVATLGKAMQRGGKEAVAAAKWWTQSRMGWSERGIVDDSKPADTPLRIIVELVGDAAPPRVEQSEPRTGSRLSGDVRKNLQLVG